MSQLSEMETVCQLLQVSLPLEGARSVGSRLGCLGPGYTDNRRWIMVKRDFRRALAMAESTYGKEGIKCCFLHFFLDAIHNGPNVAENVGGRHAHVRTRVCRTPQDVARLMLLLVVQEDFPKYIAVAEGLASDLERREEEIVALVGSLSCGRYAAPRAR